MINCEATTRHKVPKLDENNDYNETKPDRSVCNNTNTQLSNSEPQISEFRKFNIVLMSQQKTPRETGSARCDVDKLY